MMMMMNMMGGGGGGAKPSAPPTPSSGGTSRCECNSVKEYFQTFSKKEKFAEFWNLSFLIFSSFEHPGVQPTPPLFAAGGMGNGGGAPMPPSSSMVTVGTPVGKVVPSSANSRIVHPEDDVSLEELKAKKYKHLADRTSTVQFSMGMQTQPPRDNPVQQSQSYSTGDAFGDSRKKIKLFKLFFQIEDQGVRQLQTPHEVPWRVDYRWRDPDRGSGQRAPLAFADRLRVFRDKVLNFCINSERSCWKPRKSAHFGVDFSANFGQNGAILFHQKKQRKIEPCELL